MIGSMMNAIGRYDSWVDRGSAAIMGAAIAYSLLIALPGLGLAASAAMGLAGLGITYLIMRQIGPKALPMGNAEALAPLPFEAPTDLCGEVAGKVVEQVAPRPAISEIGEELLLDDILAEMEPSARVVRLFAPAPIPTAGELKARIDQHLANPERPNLSGPSEIVELPDASDALAAALDRVRHSLR